MAVLLNKFLPICVLLISIFPVKVHAENLLELTIDSPKQEYLYKEPFIINVHLKNVSKERIFIPRMIFEDEYWLIEITIKSGEISYHSPLSAIEMTRLIETITLEPGESASRSYLMNKSETLFYGGEPFPAGDYEIQAEYNSNKFSRFETPIGIWKSNVLKINVKKNSN